MHERKAEGVMFPCVHCGKEFTRATNLRVHLRSTHEGQKPFACEVPGCGERFAFKASLKRHTARGHDKNVTKKKEKKEKKKKKKKKKGKKGKKKRKKRKKKRKNKKR